MVSKPSFLNYSIDETKKMKLLLTEFLTKILNEKMEDKYRYQIIYFVTLNIILNINPFKKLYEVYVTAICLFGIMEWGKKKNKESLSFPHKNTQWNLETRRAKGPDQRR